MERVVLFLDYANINRTAADRGYALDYGHLLNYLSEGRFLVEAYCYLPINPRTPYAGDRDIEALWSQGYLVCTKTGTVVSDSYKCNFDVEITLDMMRVAHEVQPDIMVLASGDGDFVPLMLELRKQGIRVEVAAFPENTARGMILKSSGFIDLDVYCQQACADTEATPEEITVADYPVPEASVFAERKP